MSRLVSGMIFLLLCGVAGTGVGGEAKLLPPGGSAEAQFGASVAIQRTLAVVGAPRDHGSGATYIFHFDGSNWRDVSVLEPSDATDTAAFGRSVALDGDVIVVGAAYSVYVFRQVDNDVWMEEAKLEGSCGQGRFGSAVAVSGERILVGSPLIGCLGTSTKGYVFFYRHTGNGIWELERSFTTRYSTTGDYYGEAVDLDGGTAVVGSPGWGQVFAYHHDGSNWLAGKAITDPIWGSARRFGEAVSLQGGKLVVGTPLDDEQGTAAGAAYAYRQTPTDWIPEGKLLPPATHPPRAVAGSRFGLSVGLSGNLLAVGAPYSDTRQDIDEAGAAFIFRRSGSSWNFETELNASDAAPRDRLGAAVAIDDGTVLAGAPGHGGQDSNSGAAYVFTQLSPVADNEGPPLPDDTNESPTASFTHVCAERYCEFDASGSRDNDGSIVGYEWHFGDSATGTGVTVSHSYHADGTHTVWLVVTDNDGATNTTSRSITVRSGSGITLSAGGYKVRGLQKVSLSWSGASSANIDIYRDNAWIDTMGNIGSYTDNIDQRGPGTYTYQVCEEESSICSHRSTVVFD